MTEKTLFPQIVLCGADGSPVSGTSPLPIEISGSLTGVAASISQAIPGDTNGVVVNSSALPLGAATAAQIGEVQAAPTVYTVLDRLKTIATTLAASLSVVLSTSSAVIGKVGIDQTSGQNLVKPVRSATGTTTSVASSTSAVTVLASNSSRLGATVYNDSTQNLYLLVGSGTVSSTTFSIKIAPQGYYEVPFNCTAVLTGLWTAANGSARVTELT